MNLLGPDFSKAQYWTEFDERGERLVMPIRRKWKVVILALVGFLFGLVHFLPVRERPVDWMTWFGLAAVTFGALALLLNVLTSLLAREEVQVAGGELIHGWRLLGLRRERRYRLIEVLELGVHRAEDTEAKPDRLVSPLRDFGKRGSVVFSHAAGQKAALGVALDDDQAAQVVNWIARRMPRGTMQA